MPDSDVTTAAMATTGSHTILDSGACQGAVAGSGSSAVLKLKLKKPRPTRRVQWAEDTVDNEHMNKKKSKCCCIYKKPMNFGESESEDSDSDCEHCSHHKPKDFVASREGGVEGESGTAECGREAKEEKLEEVTDEEESRVAGGNFTDQAANT